MNRWNFVHIPQTPVVPAYTASGFVSVGVAMTQEYAWFRFMREIMQKEKERVRRLRLAQVFPN